MRWKIPAAVAWTLLIVALCSIPGESLPAAPAASADKLVHFAIFLVFGWLWLGVTNHSRKAAVRNVLIAGILLAGLTEIYQGLLPFDRQPDAYDVLANAAGLLAAVGAHHLWRDRQDP